MIVPNLPTFRQLARQGNLIPVCEVFRADLLTPVGAFLRLARRAPYACLLESVEGGERTGRYTFIGVHPTEIFRYRAGRCVLESGRHRRLLHEHPLTVLRQLLKRYRPVRLPGLPPLVAGAVGYFAYEMVRLVERVPVPEGDGSNVDEALLMFFSGLVVFDHVRHSVWVVETVPVEAGEPLEDRYHTAVGRVQRIRRLLEGPLPSRTQRRARQLPVHGENGLRPVKFGPDIGLRIYSNFTRERFLAAVRRALRYIRAGDAFQIVPSQCFVAETRADPFEIYRALRVINPSPYMYFLRLGPVSVVGSSPEMLLRVQGREAFYSPIAGTRPRGRDENEDRALEAELLADVKERAEHVMLVDLGRNDLGRVCEYGTVRVEQLMTVERYSHVMHLVSRLRGHLRPEVDCLEALMACFPAGTLTGAPKVRAMEIISELEPSRRGLYSGAILYLDFSGNLDSCIAIRTIVVEGGQARFQAGAGVVADSVPEREYEETVNKARALAFALQEAELPRRDGRR